MTLGCRRALYYIEIRLEVDDESHTIRYANTILLPVSSPPLLLHCSFYPIITALHKIYQDSSPETTFLVFNIERLCEYIKLVAFSAFEIPTTPVQVE